MLIYCLLHVKMQTFKLWHKMCKSNHEVTTFTKNFKENKNNLGPTITKENYKVSDDNEFPQELNCIDIN